MNVRVDLCSASLWAPIKWLGEPGIEKDSGELKTRDRRDGLEWKVMRCVSVCVYVWNDVTGMRLFVWYEPLKLDGAVNYIECAIHTLTMGARNNKKQQN